MEENPVSRLSTAGISANPSQSKVWKPGFHEFLLGKGCVANSGEGSATPAMRGSERLSEIVPTRVLPDFLYMFTQFG